jgi:catechol 2,3-dioxygenase-like lactoylglutathione lyase family enzyme
MGSMRAGSFACMDVKTLDHIALWVEDRDLISNFAMRHLGMHVIERTEKFTLIGSDARRGKLTLFAEEGPRERGALKHVALRVTDLSAAAAALPDGAETAKDGSIFVDVSEGLRIGLVEAPTEVDYDFDHVALFSGVPEETALAYQTLGFRPASASADGLPRVEAGGAFVEFHRGQTEEVERPLLNHLAVLVDSAEEHIREANELGLEIADVVDAANTYALFVWGPERVKIEYVEHKASFSLV